MGLFAGLLAAVLAWVASVVPAAPPVPAGLAGDFVRFARGGASPVFAGEVTLYIQGRQVRVLRGDSVRIRANWDACPPGWRFPRCQVSALRAVAGDLRNGLETVVAEGEPDGPCLIPEVATPPGFDHDVVVLQPGDRLRSCAYNYAVRLAVRDGEITAVDLVLNDP
jgi:hypothetical protein